MWIFSFELCSFLIFVKDDVSIVMKLKWVGDIDFRVDYVKGSVLV